MAEEQIKNSIRARRADIANYMDNYNQHYGITDRNNPDLISAKSNIIVSCRCKHGHDFSRPAHKMYKRAVDKHGVSCCPVCLDEGLQYRAGSMSLFEFANSDDDKKYLLDEWDYNKNLLIGLTPQTVSSGINKKAWWICPKGHSYDKSISKRSLGGGCPVCKGTRVVVGVNDLLSQYPEVAKDWDYSKNDKKPNEVTRHSNIRVYWKCHKCGHEWETEVSSRTNEQFPGTCPKCINHGMSRMEMCIYLAIKKHLPDAEYRAKIDKTEFDVYIPSAKLAVEYDGIYFHRDLKRREMHKDIIAAQNGLQFFRIEEVDDKGVSFLFENNTLKVHTNKNTRYLEICALVLQHIRDDFGIPIEVPVDEDIVFQAFTEMSTVVALNSLAAKYPDIAAEWHPTKNGDLKPEHLDAHSHVKVWWICKNCGNEFLQTVGRRTGTKKKNDGCAFCTGQRRLVGFNDLETLYPGIKQYWCQEENEKIGMIFEVCAPTSVKYTYWNFGEGVKLMQIRNAIFRYKTIMKNKENEMDATL